MDQGEFDRRLRRAVTLVVSVCALVVALALMAVADGNGPHLRAQTALGPFLGGEPATVPSVPLETPVSRPNGGRAHAPAPASIPPAPAATVSAAPPVERMPATLLVRTVESQPPPPAAPTTIAPTTGPRTPTTTPPTTTPGSTGPPPTKPPPTTVPPVTAGHGGHGEGDGGSGDDHDHEGGHHSRGHPRSDHDGSDHDGQDDPSGRNRPDGRRTS